MYRLLLGLIIPTAIALWSGAATAQALQLPIVVDTEILLAGGGISEGKFRVINHTDDFSVKGFAVTLGTALTANLDDTGDILIGWRAEPPTDVNPIDGLPGSAGGIGDDKEYVFYHVRPDNPEYYLRPGTAEERFLFTLIGTLAPGSHPFFPFGILAVDREGREVTCIGSGGYGCQVLSKFSAPGPATLWVGLKSGDDQGTQFDLRAEVDIIGAYDTKRVAVG